jgi:hypothetical protein
MASITPRLSRFWADRGRTSYYPDDHDGDMDVEQQCMIDEAYDATMECDDRTPLGKTIDRMGMGV